jgi:hypothetical protein
MAQSAMVAILGRMAAYTGQSITWDMAIKSEQRLGPVSYEPGALAVDPPATPGRTPFV